MATATKFDWMTCDEPAEMARMVRAASKRKKSLALEEYHKIYPDLKVGAYDESTGPDWFVDDFCCICAGCEKEEYKQARCNILREIFPPPTLTFDPAWRTPTVIGLAQRIDGQGESVRCSVCYGTGTRNVFTDRERDCNNCGGTGKLTVLSEPDFSAMPILADALEEAGCEDEQILRHCRGIPARCDGGCEFHPEWGLFCTYEMAGPDSRWVTCKRCAGSGEKEPQPHLRGCWVIDLILERE